MADREVRRPSVSVVIPAYNCARWLGSAVRSVLSQTVAPQEIIVVDDGSTDDTPSIVRALGPRVRYYPQRNSGVSVARNEGARVARGEFIAYLDADDEWFPSKLEVQLERLASKPEAIASFMSVIRVDETSGQEVTLKYRFSDDLVERLLLESCIVGHSSSVLIRRTALQDLGGFSKEFSQCADWDMWLRLADSGPVDVVEEALVLYRWHESNMSRNAGLLERDTLRVLDRFYGAAENAARFGALKERAYANHYLIFSGAYLHAGRLQDSVRCLTRALWLHPAHISRALGTPLRAVQRALSAAPSP